MFNSTKTSENLRILTNSLFLSFIFFVIDEASFSLDSKHSFSESLSP